MINIKNIFIVLFLTISITAYTQPDTYAFSVNGKQISPQLEMATFIKNKALLSDYLYENRYYVIVQYNSIPDRNYIHTMRDKVDLLFKINDYTYKAAVDAKISKKDVKKLGIKYIYGLQPDWKVEKNLASTIFTTTEPQSAYVAFPKDITDKKVKEELNLTQDEIGIKTYQQGIIKYKLNLSADKFKALIAKPFVLSVSLNLMD